MTSFRSSCHPTIWRLWNRNMSTDHCCRRVTGACWALEKLSAGADTRICLHEALAASVAWSLNFVSLTWTFVGLTWTDVSDSRTSQLSLRGANHIRVGPQRPLRGRRTESGARLFGKESDMGLAKRGQIPSLSITAGQHAPGADVLPDCPDPHCGFSSRRLHASHHTPFLP